MAHVFRSPSSGPAGTTARGDDNEVRRYYDRFGCITHSRQQIARSLFLRFGSGCVARGLSDPTCDPNCINRTPSRWRTIALEPRGYFTGGTLWARTVWLSDWAARLEMYAEIDAVDVCNDEGAICKFHVDFLGGSGLSPDVSGFPWRESFSRVLPAGRSVWTMSHTFDDPEGWRPRYLTAGTIGRAAVQLSDDSGVGQPSGELTSTRYLPAKFF